MACGKKSTACADKTDKTEKKAGCCGGGCKADKTTTACKGCGMAIKADKDCGTNADGTKNCMYCVHCFKKGKKQ